MTKRLIFATATVLFFIGGGAFAADQMEIKRHLQAVGCLEAGSGQIGTLKYRSAIRCFQKSIVATPTGVLTDAQIRDLAKKATVEIKVEKQPVHMPDRTTSEDLEAARGELEPRKQADNNAAWSAEATASWKYIRDSGNPKFVFGDGICSVGEASTTEMRHCVKYLSDTAGDDMAVYCAASDLSGPNRYPPGTCWALPASLCQNADGDFNPVFKNCWARKDREDPAAGSIGFRPEASENLQWRIVVLSEFLKKHPNQPVSSAAMQALQTKIRDTPNRLKEIHAKRRFEERPIKTLKSGKRIPNSVKFELAVYGFRSALSCPIVLKHEQLDEIIAGRVRGGDKELIENFCRSAAQCTAAAHNMSEFGDSKRAFEAFNTRLCSDRNIDLTYESLDGARLLTHAQFVVEMQRLGRLKELAKLDPDSPEAFQISAEMLAEIKGDAGPFGLIRADFENAIAGNALRALRMEETQLRTVLGLR